MAFAGAFTQAQAPPLDRRQLQCPSAAALLRQTACRRASLLMQPCTASVASPDTASELLQRAAEPASSSDRPEPFDGRAFRRALGKTGRYTRNPRNDKESLALMDEHGVGYSLTGLIAQMRDTGKVWKQGDVTVRLADAYGFCWGVERAVQMAYEARRAYPDRKLHVTNEIIHNPSVNQRLRDMSVSIIEDAGQGKDFSDVRKGDVVILPAFGASVQEMQMLNDREVELVDTTCPWVSKVWNAVDNQGRKRHTSIIHGKWAHEETIATASFATTYLIVKNLPEAQYVCDYILNGGDREEFYAKFDARAMSRGFDPDRDLERVGIANQTTMLKGETEQIGKLLEQTMLRKVGPAALKDHFMLMDTICDATQERQDAVTDLVSRQEQEDTRLDIMIVVGGFNSSNTSHLQEIPEKAGVPSFWVDSAACIDAQTNTIKHKTSWGELLVTENWLPEGPITVGVTSGASTPDRSVEDVLDKVFQIKDPTFAGVAPRDCAPPVKPTH